VIGPSPSYPGLGVAPGDKETGIGEMGQPVVAHLSSTRGEPYNPRLSKMGGKLGPDHGLLTFCHTACWRLHGVGEWPHRATDALETLPMFLIYIYTHLLLYLKHVFMIHYRYDDATKQV